MDEEAAEGEDSISSEDERKMREVENKDG